MIRFKILTAALTAIILAANEFVELKAESPAPGIEIVNTGRLLGFKSISPAIPVPEKEEASTPDRLNVSASVYFPVPEQTDSTPFITADGSRINKQNPGKHRWVAISRNLHTRWGGHISYGDSLFISGISGELDGVYIVRDVMNRRIRNRVDILVGEQDQIMGYWKNVSIATVD